MPFVNQDNQFSFSGPPKCGCTWMLQAMGNAGVVLERKASTRVHLPGTVEGVPSITFTRPPADWLRSYWQNMQGRKANVSAIDDLQSLDWSSLDSFVDGYLKRFPGRISEIFSLYDSDHNIELTDLPGKLIDILEELGVRSYVFDQNTGKGEWRSLLKGAISDTEPQNVTRPIVTLPTDLHDAILEAEGVLA